MRGLKNGISVILALLLSVGILFGLAGWTALRALQAMMTEECIGAVVDATDMGDLALKMTKDTDIELVAQIARTEPMQQLTKDYFKGYMHYVLTGEGTGYVASDTQKDEIAEATMGVLSDTTGISSGLVYNIMKVTVRAAVESLTAVFLPSYQNLDMGLTQEDMVTMRRLLEPMTRALLLGLAILCTALLLLVRMSWYKWLAWSGASALVAGLSMAFGKVLLAARIIGANAGDETLRVITAGVVDRGADALVHNGLMVAIIGVVMLVLFGVFRYTVGRRAD